MLCTEFVRLQAQFNLALAYMNGDGLERDDKKGAIWLKRAAKSGDPDAQFKLAMLHRYCVSNALYLLIFWLFQ